VALPGPPAGLWALSLLVWAAAAAVVGEAVRGTAQRWVRLWCAPGLLERAVLDLYLGGASLYLLAALEVGAFVRPVVLAVPVLAGGLVLYRAVAARRAGAGPALAARLRSAVTDRWMLLAVASAAGLYAVEVAAAVPAGTGNTYDSSLLTTYVALLLQHGSVPLSFRPYGTQALLYPQGTTVWLGWAQLVFGLPPARTSLLVTPLFLGLAPLSGFVLGRAWVGTARAGAAFAIALAWLGPSTRALVGGSNDFVVAFPLVLLLAAQAVVWRGDRLPSPGDAVGFGLLAGYAAVLNVVGTEWLLPALLLLGASARPAFAGRRLAWLGRWASAVAAAAVAGLPPLYVLAAGRASPASLAGVVSAPSNVAVGIGVPQLVGSLDPFLFHAGDVELSPIPLVRLELAVLLVLGVGILLYLATQTEGEHRWSGFASWALAAAVASAAWLLLLCAAGVAGSPLRPLAYISSAAEASLWLFAVYGLLAAVPLAVAFHRLPRRPSGRGTAPVSLRAFAPVVVAVVLVVPGVVLTPVSLGPVLSSTYTDFGNVSAADFQMLAWGGSHLAPGERVLVAPGSAGEFLPGYARGIVLLFPMAPGWSRVNRSYTTVVGELTNGTLDAAGRAALASLAPSFVVVTGNNTILWGAFWASTLLQAETNGTPTFPVAFHDGDAWVFNASACRPGSAACG